MRDVKLTFSSLVSLALASVRNPKEVANTLLSVGFPASVLMPSFLLVIVVSVLLTVPADLIGAQSTTGALFPPFSVAIVLCLLLAAYIYGIYRVGRAMGGTGSLAEAVLLMVFLQFILILAQVVELLLWLIAPMLAGYFVIGVAILALWISMNFIDVLHGYGSLFKSFGLIILVSFSVAVGMVIILSTLGIGVQVV